MMLFKELESYHTPMEKNMMVNGLRDKEMAKENSSLVMKNIQDIGKIIRKKEWAH